MNEYGVDPLLGSSQWSIVIFASRESPMMLEQTLDAIRAAARPCPLIIEVLINGNPDLVESLKSPISGEKGLNIRLWSISKADKANAWSRYFQEIWSGEDLVFFIDGYVRVRPNALESLGSVVMEDKHALGGTGVPTIGRTAAAAASEMLSSGGFQGNLCCLKGMAISEIRRRKIALPLGLYRVDSFVASLLHLAFDPAGNAWDRRRVRVDGAASWDIEEKRWWRWKDISAKYRRSLRQARGLMENAAIKEHLLGRRAPPERLPEDVSVLLRSWSASHPATVRSMKWRHPLVWLALRKLQMAETLNVNDLRPQLVAVSACRKP